jgi:hypothetical protein
MTLAGAARASEPTSPRSEDSETPRAPASRLPLLVFAGVEVGAFAYYLVLARTQWFFADEWEFLSARGLNVHDLLRAHYGHWVAVPIVAYRVLWAIVGLRSYLPYASVTIALHLTAAALLWVVMRRSGVGPWTSALAASVFALFGAGAQDLLWAFQVTFTGALVFGLAHLLLADHDGPVDRRDWSGLGAGLLALACSGVAVTMVVVVGSATLIRRGWRVAALHSAPLGVVYVGWWARYSRGRHTFRGSARQVFDWVVSGAAGLFGALGQIPGVGWVLGLGLVGGLALALRDRGLPAIRARSSMAVALLIGAVAFLVIAGYDRGGVGASFARSSRYLHILAALVIPAIAVAIDTLLRRSQALGCLALAALLVGVPGNIARADDYAQRQRSRDDATRQLMLSIVRSPLARKAPRELRPEPNLAPTLTIGWLIDGVASGRVPARSPGPARERHNRLRLSLMELDRPSGLPCRALDAPTPIRLATGDRIGIVGTVSVGVVGRPSEQTAPVAFGSSLLNAAFAHTLVAVAGPLNLRIAPAPSSFAAALCTAESG